VESAEAAAKVEQWLLDAYGPDSGLRVDSEHVVLTPEGWSIPYNNAEFLATGKIDRAIFPLPRLVVTEPAGELRFEAPHPGQLSLPIATPGRPYWTEIIDPEYEQAGFDRLVAGLIDAEVYVPSTADGQAVQNSLAICTRS
jgi:hypothetical protein